MTRTKHHEYAGFWRRALALAVDRLVLSPVILLMVWAIAGAPRGLGLALVLPLSAVPLAYEVVLHAYFGQTLGKRLARVRVVQVSGARIGWGHALRRASVDAVFTVASAVAIGIALWHVPALDAGQSFIERAALLDALQPAWARPVTLAMQIWCWSEVVVMLMNRERRALHDFIGGTVVVRARRSEQPLSGATLQSA